MSLVLINGVKKCWPCQKAKIAGICGSTISYTSAGSNVNRLVRHTSRRKLAARNPQRAETNCCAARYGSDSSTEELFVLIGIEQPMEMNDEISHLGIVDRLLRLGFPGGIGTGVIGEYPDDFHLRKILERVVRQIVQFAAKDEMQQLL